MAPYYKGFVSADVLIPNQPVEVDRSVSVKLAWLECRYRQALGWPQDRSPEVLEDWWLHAWPTTGPESWRTSCGCVWFTTTGVLTRWWPEGTAGRARVYRRRTATFIVVTRAPGCHYQPIRLLTGQPPFPRIYHASPTAVDAPPHLSTPPPQPWKHERVLLASRPVAISHVLQPLYLCHSELQHTYVPTRMQFP